VSADVVQEIGADVSNDEVDRIVLDLRINGGGQAEGYRQLLEYLADPSLELPGGLYVLVGRLTFSAAASFVAEIERDVPEAIFVGEATGGAPNYWADVDTVTLPHSGMKVLISTTYEGYGRPNDPRLAIEPDIPVDLSAADYFSDRDPVLAAALAAP
jgi:C-terminal processing protease CtpA/Prc